MNRLFFVVTIALLLSACATPPSPLLEAARVEVDALRADASIRSNAAVAVTEAEDAIRRAELAENLEEREHQASLATIYVQIARVRSARRGAQERAEAAAKRADELQMEAETHAARRQSAKADRRAALLRQQAEAERRRAELERQRSEQARAEAADLQSRLAELKPDLTSRGLVLTLGEVLFDFDSARLKPYGERIMQRLAEYLVANPELTLSIEGHTDNSGDAEDNLELSASRAVAVAESLTARGVANSRMRAEGLGESRPVASNETSEGRKQNRRVEVIVTQL